MRCILYLQPSRQNWQKVFYISSAIYAFGAIEYAVFGSGKLQPWAQTVGSDTEPLLVDPDEENLPRKK